MAMRLSVRLNRMIIENENRMGKKMHYEDYDDDDLCREIDALGKILIKTITITTKAPMPMPRQYIDFCHRRYKKKKKTRCHKR